MRAALVLVLLAGCAIAEMHKVPDSAPAELTISWVRVDRDVIAFYCPSSARVAAAQGRKVNACARETARGCTIYTADLVSARLFGHEALHCFGVDVHLD